MNKRNNGVLCRNFVTGLLMAIGIFLFSFAEAKMEVRKQVCCFNDSSLLYPAKPNDISPLLVGEAIPLGILKDVNGNSFNLNEKLSKQPTILIFYRGGWCPYCNKQLSGIQQIEGQLRKMGYQIVAVSTDSPKNLSKTLDKQHLTYTLLSDDDLSLSKKFGIAYKAPVNYEAIVTQGSEGKNVDKLLPVPSVFILSTKGLIEFEYINPDFQQRISPELLSAAASAIIKQKS